MAIFNMSYNISNKQYSYNFIGKTMTQVVDDGWLGTSNWNIDSNGLYRNSWTPMYKTLPFSLSNVKEIVITATVLARKASGTNDVAVGISNILDTQCTAGNYIGGVVSNGSGVWTGTDFNRYTWGTDNTTIETTWTAIFDLVNKTVTISHTAGGTPSPNSFSLTDTQISLIRSSTYIKCLQNGTTDRIKSLSVSAY